MLSAAAMATDTTLVTFNDYPNATISGDRSNTNMLNRPSVAGIVRCEGPGLCEQIHDGENVTHLFGPGEFAYGDKGGRRKCAYYWNPGIQEFAEAGNTSANVMGAYIWGHAMSYGHAGPFQAVSAAINVYWDSIPGYYEWSDWAVNGLITYEDMDSRFLSLPDTGTYQGYDDGQRVYAFKTLAKAMGYNIVFNVTGAVKYIMDHPDSVKLGIMVKPFSDQGQLGYEADENGFSGNLFQTLLTIVYSGAAILPDAVERADATPARLSLAQNSPNPFSTSTAIRFEVPSRQNVRLAVYTVDGRLVRILSSGPASGSRTLRWDGTDSHGNRLINGVYVCKLITGDKSIAKKMVLIRN
jgi:hypothetical protein